MIESDIRFRDDQFRQAGIVIAFPQRDVHLDVRGPLDPHLNESPSHEAEKQDRTTPFTHPNRFPGHGPGEGPS